MKALLGFAIAQPKGMGYAKNEIALIYTAIPDFFEKSRILYLHVIDLEKLQTSRRIRIRIHAQSDGK